LATIYDEPFSDSSQIPTYLVSQLAKKHVTVALSGDGGDELFAGYNRHVVGPEIWRKTSRLPYYLQKLLGSGLRALSAYNLDAIRPFLPQRLAVADLALRVEKLSDALNANNGLAYYKSLASHWKYPETLVLHSQEPHTLLDKVASIPNLPGLREQMMYLDQMTYLPDDILTKVDRASMAVSLEARVPLLDHRLVEFAWQVPTKFKYRDGQGKWLLRQVLYRYVPRELMERPKQGFGVPIEHWLRGPLRDWAEELLNERRLREEGFFNPAPIRTMWKDHVTGKRRWHYYLWDVLMFQQWLNTQKR
jgi:asparagine synthase (glutamine-hydrolysing)